MSVVLVPVLAVGKLNGGLRQDNAMSGEIIQKKSASLVLISN